MTVNNATTAVAGRSHTLSCSVSGANLETATVMYTWRLNDAVIQGTSASNLYNIATDNDPIQVSNAGEVYSCEVTVTGASYWDVSGSFGGRDSATLSVTSEYLVSLQCFMCICMQLLYPFSPVAVPTPTILFTKLTLGSQYGGLNFTWRCEVELPGRHLSGVSASVEWIGPNGTVLTSDSRITVGDTLETSPGREYQKTLSFLPLSDGDSGSYSCSATVIPTTSNSLVTIAVGTGSESLSVTSKNLSILICVCTIVFNFVFAPGTTLSVNLERTSVPSRVLDLPTYNGFTLTCTATSRAVNLEVVVTKAITWMRSVNGGNPQLLTDSDMSSSDMVVISSTDLQMTTAMSMLTVNTTVAGSYVYTCSANLSIMPAPDIIRNQSMTTIVVQG